MLLLLMLMTQQDLVEEAVRTPSPTPEEMVAAREKLGLDIFQAACISGYKKSQNWYLAETGQSQMDEDRWVLFLLRAGMHKQIRMIDKYTGTEPKIVYPSRSEQAKLNKFQPSATELFELRSKLNKTQAEMCKLARIKFISNWGALESGVVKMSSEKWFLLELQLGVHQQCEIRLRDERLSSITSFEKAIASGNFLKTSPVTKNDQVYGIKHLGKSSLILLNK